MARTKGAMGRKNLPTITEFKEKIAQLSIQYLKRLGEIAGNPEAAPSEILRAANLVVPLHYQIIQEGGGDSGASGKTEVKDNKQPDYTAPLVDFANKKAERDQKAATK